jgi:hypothetical protein
VKPPAVWERVRDDRLVLGAAAATGVDLWFAVAFVDVRVLLALPVIGVATYAAARVRGPRVSAPDDVDDWY